MTQEAATMALNGINPIYPRVSPGGSVSKTLPRQLAAGLALEEGKAANTLHSDESNGSGALGHTGNTPATGAARRQMTSMYAAAQLLQLAQVNFKPQTDFLTTNRVVAVLEKAVERLQLLGLLDTSLLHAPRTAAATTGQTGGETNQSDTRTSAHDSTAEVARVSAEEAATQLALASMLGLKRSSKVRTAAVFATPTTASLRGTSAAVTAALLRAGSAPLRGRPTVAQLMHEQQQLEARYGELLRATRHGAGSRLAVTAGEGKEPGVTMQQCFSHVRDPAQAALQHELRSVAARLRDHNKILCTQLKDNPQDMDNWNKICNERRELIALLQAAIAELTTGYQEACRSRHGTGTLDVSLTHAAVVSQSVSHGSGASEHAGADAAAARRSSSSSEHSISSKATVSDVYSLSQSNATTLSKRFGSMTQLRKATKSTGAVARIPLLSSYETFASKVLQEQAAQRWADELVRKERELNQNVKQLQSDLLHERGMKEKELAERRARIAQLRVQLRERRAALREAGHAARAHERAAAEALRREANAVDRVVLERTAAATRLQEQEEQTYALFSSHITARTAAMDTLASQWEQKNQLEIKHMEACKLDAEQTWQHSTERLEECRRNEVVQQRLQREREERRRVEAAAREAEEQRRVAEYEAASVLESAIRATLTRMALAKLRKGTRRGKKNKKDTA